MDSSFTLLWLTKGLLVMDSSFTLLWVVPSRGSLDHSTWLLTSCSRLPHHLNALFTLLRDWHMLGGPPWTPFSPCFGFAPRCLPYSVHPEIVWIVQKKRRKKSGGEGRSYIWFSYLSFSQIYLLNAVKKQITKGACLHSGSGDRHVKIWPGVC